MSGQETDDGAVASDTQHEAGATSTATLDVPEEPFDSRDIEQFAADDVEAGRAIGKMLSLLFVYTVIAMSIVVWWTYTTVWQK